MLDRELQRNILRSMANQYPEVVPIQSLKNEFPEQNVEINLHYLTEHALIDANIQLKGGAYSYGSPRINHRGMDFLADDGGLAAILGVVTVKLHDQTIRDLLEKKIQDSGEDPAVKASLLKAIREAPSSAIKQISEYAIQKGLENLPNITPLLQMLTDR